MASPARYERALDAAVADGVLRPDQAEDVRARAGAGEKAARQDRTIRIASWIAATLVAVGIITWVAQNWQAIPDSVRTLMLAAVAGLAIAGAWALLERQHPVTGHGLLVIGGAAIGGTVFQVANWVHLPPDNPLLLGIWLLSLLPLAYAFRSAPMLMAAVLVLPFWLGFLFIDDPGLTGQTMVLLFAATALAVAGSAFLHTPGRWPGFRAVLLGMGTAGVLLVGFVATFTARTHAVGSELFGFTGPVTLWLAAAFGLAVAGAGRAAARAGGATWDHGVLGLLGLVTLTAGFGTGLVLPNILYPLWVIALILVAVQAGSELVLDIGLAFFVIEVVGRYFDFLFDEMQPAIFFIVGGLLLFAVTFFAERIRRRVRPEVEHA